MQKQILEIEAAVKPRLKSAGWNENYCVAHFIKDLFKLYIRTGNVSAYSFFGTNVQRLEQLPSLIKNVQKSVALMNKLNELGKYGYSHVRGDHIKSLNCNKM